MDLIEWKIGFALRLIKKYKVLLNGMKKRKLKYLVGVHYD